MSTPAGLAVKFLADPKAVLEAQNRIERGFSDLKGKVGGHVGGIMDKVTSLGSGIGGLANIGARAGTAIVAGLAAGGVAIGAFAGSAISAYSDVAEASSKVEVVFKEQADSVKKWADDAVTAFGLSRGEALKAVGTYGNLLTAMKLPEEQAAKMSTSLVGLAADLGSFNNMDTTEVLDKLRAGLVGETEPLKALGVNMNQARLEAKALEMGLLSQGQAFKDLPTDLQAAAKAQAGYAIILEDTTAAQGDFARTSSGLANATRIIQSSFQNFREEIGQRLYPVVTPLVGLFGRILPTALKVPIAALDAVMGAADRATKPLQYLGVIMGGNFGANPEAFREAAAGLDAMGAQGARIRALGDDLREGRILLDVFREGVMLEPDMSWLERLQNGFGNLHAFLSEAFQNGELTELIPPELQGSVLGFLDVLSSGEPTLVRFGKAFSAFAAHLEPGAVQAGVQAISSVFQTISAGGSSADVLRTVADGMRGVSDASDVSVVSGFFDVIAGGADVAATLADKANELALRLFGTNDAGKILSDTVTDLLSLLGIGADESDRFTKRMGLMGEEQENTRSVVDLFRDSVADVKSKFEEAWPKIKQFVDLLVDLGDKAVEHRETIMQFSGAVMVLGQLAGPLSAMASLTSIFGRLGGFLIANPALVKGVVAAIGGISLPVTAVIAAVGLLLVAWKRDWGGIQGKTKAAVEEIKRFIDGIPERFRKLIDDVEAWFSDFSQAFRDHDWGKLGQMIVDGLKAGLRAAWDASIPGLMTNLLSGLWNRAKRDTESMSPSGLYKRLGRWLMEGLALGIELGGRSPQKAMADAIAGLRDAEAGLEASRQRWAEYWQSVTQGAHDAKESLDFIMAQMMGGATMGESWMGRFLDVGAIREQLREGWNEVNGLIAAAGQAQGPEAQKEALDAVIARMRELENERHELFRDEAARQGISQEHYGWILEEEDKHHDRVMAHIDAQSERFSEYDEMRRQAEADYQEALRQAQDAVKAAQEAAEAFAERVHEGVMSRLQEERDAREAFWDSELRRLESMHNRRVQSLEAEIAKLEESTRRRKDGLEDAKKRIEGLELDMDIPGEQRKLEALRQDLEAFGKAMAGVTKLSGDPVQERQEWLARRRERMQLTTDDQRGALQNALGSGLIRPEDVRTVQMALQGQRVRATDLERIIAEITDHYQHQVDRQQGLIDRKQQELAIANQLLAQAQHLADLEDARIQREIAGVQARLNEENRRFEQERSHVEALRDVELAAIDRRIAAEERRHEKRMTDIAAEYAMELALLNHSQAEIDALIAEALRQAQRIAAETERIYRSMREGSGNDPVRGTPDVPDLSRGGLGGADISPDRGALTPAERILEGIRGATEETADNTGRTANVTEDEWRQRQRERVPQGERVPNYSGRGEDAYRVTRGFWGDPYFIPDPMMSAPDPRNAPDHSQAGSDKGPGTKIYNQNGDLIVITDEEEFEGFIDSLRGWR